MKKGIIVASFGTSYPETRKKTLDVIEQKFRQNFSDAKVVKAYTSQKIIKIVAKKEHMTIDGLAEAIDRLLQEGIDHIYIQPIHIIPGVEYHKIIRVAEQYQQGKSVDIKVSTPLLFESNDYDTLANILSEQADKATLFMGHGTYHKADTAYQQLQETIHAKGDQQVFIASLEGKKDLDQVVRGIKAAGVTDLRLQPLLMVAGDHVQNDMLSDEEDSWKSILEEQGFHIEPVATPLGEMPAVHDIFMDKLRKVIQA